MAQSAGGTVNVSIGATFASTFKTAFGQAEQQIGRLGSTVRDLDGKLSRIRGFDAAKDQAERAAIAYRKSDAALRSMSQQLAGAEYVTQAQAREFKDLERQTESLRKKMVESASAVDRMQTELEQAGIDTRNLAGDQRELQRQLTQTTNRMQALAAFGNTGLGTAIGNVGSNFRSLATQAAVTGGVLGYVFKTQFIDVASEFERFRTILETTEGSAAKADQSMKWISDFAAKTPYELAEVTDAFVKLRAYGLDPTNGLLKALGDTSAAMGKPVMQAVEAIADAVNGENERLKEFGIRAAKEGNKIVYTYVNAAGKQMTATVDKNNRAMIQSTLQAIMNEKYAGAMDKLSTTWAGMVSNLKDQWARFTNTAMNAGLFDWMKNRLGGVLNQLNQAAADGRLQVWAEMTGAKLVTVAENAWRLGTAIASTTARIAEMVGGWENLGIALVALKFAPLIVSLGQVGLGLFKGTTALLMFAFGTGTAGAAWMAFGTAMAKGAAMAMGALMKLGIFMLTTPIGLVLTALGAAAYLLWDNWDTVTQYMGAAWSWLSDKALAAWEVIKTAFSWSPLGMIITNWEPLKAWFMALPNQIAGVFAALPSQMLAIGGQIIDGLVAGVKAKWESAKAYFAGLPGQISGGFKAALGIQSPSRVFAGIGDDTIAGLGMGLERSTPGVLAQMGGLAKQLAMPIAATASLAGSPAMAGTTPAPSASIVPAAVAQAAPSASQAGGQTFAPTYNITVQGSGDPQGIAKAIRAELDRRDREAMASRRSNLTDDLGY